MGGVNVITLDKMADYPFSIITKRYLALLVQSQNLPCKESKDCNPGLLSNQQME